MHVPRSNTKEANDSKYRILVGGDTFTVVSDDNPYGMDRFGNIYVAGFLTRAEAEATVEWLLRFGNASESGAS